MLIMCNNLGGFVYVSIGIKNLIVFFFFFLCGGEQRVCASGALLVYRAQVMT